MIQYRMPIYRNTPQELDYVFVDQDGAIINLTSFTNAFLVVKHQGEVYATVPAVIVSASGGQVKYGAYKFDKVGTWDAQFYCSDGTNELDGEPIQFRVVPNVKDLDLTELPKY